MKRVTTVISVVMASILFSAISIFGAENFPLPFGSFGKNMESYRKNECLIVAKNCATEPDTVRQRLMDLRKEIDKGYKVYTPTELNMLKEQLKWIVNESKDITG
ncbi:MAG TPA: hypothetical protein VN642_05475 [Dongiaceae bacterium]|nr:hypothetical protein [Dongiaceae bacterium]